MGVYRISNGSLVNMDMVVFIFLWIGENGGAILSTVVILLLLPLLCLNRAPIGLLELFDIIRKGKN